MSFSIMANTTSDDVVLRRLKKQARREQRFISDVIRDAFRLYLEQNNGKVK